MPSQQSTDVCNSPLASSGNPTVLAITSEQPCFLHPMQQSLISLHSTQQVYKTGTNCHFERDGNEVPRSCWMGKTKQGKYVRNTCLKDGRRHVPEELVPLVCGELRSAVYWLGLPAPIQSFKPQPGKNKRKKDIKEQKQLVKKKKTNSNKKWSKLVL